MREFVGRGFKRVYGVWGVWFWLFGLSLEIVYRSGYKEVFEVV